MEKRFSCPVAAALTVCLLFSQVWASTGTVNYSIEYQQLEGFGGATVYDVTTLTQHSQRETIYNLLFKDLGLDHLRIRNSVGYDDASVTATKTIVAAARQSGRNPDLKLEMVPWSPPGIYKSNGSVNGGTLAKSGGVYVYTDYAAWWYNSLQTWAASPNGLVPDYISIQNEPDIATDYDSCRFDPQENSYFAGYDLAFQAVYNQLYAHYGSNMPKMLAPETMGYGNSTGYIQYLNALGQMGNIYGFSHHLYSDGSYDYPDSMISGMENYAVNYGEYYDKPIFMTEITKNNSEVNFDMAIKMAWHIYNSLYHEGVTSFYWWTLIRGTTSTGGAINLPSLSSYSIRDIYWFLKHYSYFTDPNWSVVDTSTNSTNLRMSAFKNPSGDKLTVVILNKSTTADSMSLNLNGYAPNDSNAYRSSASEHWLPVAYTNPLPLPALSITTISFYIVGPHHTLISSSSEGGSVTTPGEGHFEFAEGTDANLVATPDKYYHFVNWTGTAVDAGKVVNPNAAVTKVLMDANYSVIANFEANPPDYNAPQPNPMTWDLVPTTVDLYTITMTATTAVDENNPPVSYYFECVTDNNKSSDWQLNPVYTATGLTPSTTYTFRVMARDDAITPNMTGWSSEESTTTDPPDTWPPSPNPMQWAAVPTAINSTVIIMTAATATDENNPPVSYYFECLTDSNKSSNWQLNPTYYASGLIPDTEYTFRVKARDSAPVINETDWSITESATTPLPSTDVELLGSFAEGTTNPKMQGTDRALIFIAHAKYSSSLNLMSVMYGGQTMTKIVDKNYSTGDGYAYVAAFILKEPGIAAASNGTFTPTWNSTPSAAGYSSIFVCHVNQTTPISASASGGTSAGTATTTALANVSGDMVFDAVTCGQTGSYTLNNGFTEGIDRQIDSLITGAAGYKSATGVNETPSAAFNGTVNGQSIIGFVVKAGTTDVPPSPPTNLTTTADFYNIVIDWNDNPEPDIAGYNIFMSTTPGTGYSRLNSMLLTSSNYTKDDVSVGTRYYFVVTAVDAAGLESPFSAEVSAKPGYQTCQEVINAGYQDYSDYNGDCRTDYKDLLHLVSYWLSSNCVEPDYCEFADLDLSGTVDFTDFMYFSYEWMRCYEPLDDNCTPTW